MVAIMTGLCPSVSQADDGYVIFAENFEYYSATQTSPAPPNTGGKNWWGGSPYAYYAEEADSEHGKSAKIVRSGSHSYIGTPPGALSGRKTVECEVQLTSYANSSVTVIDNSGKTHAAVLFNSDGKLYLGETEKEYYYNPGRWYKIRFTSDFNSGTLEVYIDDTTCEKTNIKVDDIKQIRFQHTDRVSGNEALYVDNLIITDDPFRAEYRADNILRLFWSNEREGTLSVYGKSSPESTESKIIFENKAVATNGSYDIELKEEDDSYSNYYTFCFSGDDKNITRTVKTETLLQRRTNMAISNSHPHFIANQADVERVKAAISAKHSFYSRMYDYITENAMGLYSKYLEYTEVSCGDVDSNPNHQIARDLADIAVAYALSDDIRYFNAVRHMLLLYADYCKEETNYLSTQIKDESYFVFGMACAYDLIYNDLTETDRNIIEENYFRATAEKLKKMPQPGALHGAGQTHYGLMQIGFLLNDHELIDAGLNNWAGVRYFFLNGIGDDNLWWESIGYHAERLEFGIFTAEAAYNSGYDMYNWKSCGYRDKYVKNYNDTVDAEFRRGDDEELYAEKGLKNLIDGYMDFVLSDGSYPAIGDTDGESRLKNISLVFEAAYSRLGDSKYAWVLNQDYSTARNTENYPDIKSIFLLKPEIEEGNFELINSRIGKRSYHKEGSSKYGDMGVAIFRAAGEPQDSVNAVMNWAEYGTSRHSHADKLGIMIYGRGENMMPEIGRYNYRTLPNKEFANHTVAHNTVVVDMSSQAPLKTANEEYLPDENVSETAGELINMAIGPTSSLMKAENSNAYGHLGVSLNRSLWMMDDYVIDIFNATGTSAHTFDMPYIINGELYSTNLNFSEDKDENASLGTDSGYQHIRRLSKTEPTTDMWNAVWKTEKGYFRTTTYGGALTELIKGKAIDSTGEYTQNIMLARRSGVNSVNYVTVLETEKSNSFRDITQKTVSVEEKYANKASSVKALEIKNSAADFTDTFMYGLAGVKKTLGKLSSDGESAILRQGADGKDLIIGAQNAKIVSGSDVSLSFEKRSSVQFTKLGASLYRLDMGEQEETNVKIQGITGCSLYKMPLSDTVSLQKIGDFSGEISFTAEGEGIYILSVGDAYKNMPLPRSANIQTKDSEMIYEDIPEIYEDVNLKFHQGDFSNSDIFKRGVTAYDFYTEDFMGKAAKDRTEAAEKLKDWKLVQSSVATVSVPESNDGYGESLYFRKGGTGRIFNDFSCDEQTKDIRLSFDIKFTNPSDVYISTIHGNAGISGPDGYIGAILFSADNKGSFGENSFSYKTNVWHNITLDMKLSRKTYDFYFDGKLVGENESMWQYLKNFKGIRFDFPKKSDNVTGASDDAFYIDNLVLSQLTGIKENFTDLMENDFEKSIDGFVFENVQSGNSVSLFQTDKGKSLRISSEVSSLKSPAALTQKQSTKSGKIVAEFDFRTDNIQSTSFIFSDSGGRSLNLLSFEGGYIKFPDDSISTAISEGTIENAENRWYRLLLELDFERKTASVGIDGKYIFRNAKLKNVETLGDFSFFSIAHGAVNASEHNSACFVDNFSLYTENEVGRIILNEHFDNGADTDEFSSSGIERISFLRDGCENPALLFNGDSYLETKRSVGLNSNFSYIEFDLFMENMKNGSLSLILSSGTNEKTILTAGNEGISFGGVTAEIPSKKWTKVKIVTDGINNKAKLFLNGAEKGEISLEFPTFERSKVRLCTRGEIDAVVDDLKMISAVKNHYEAETFTFFEGESARSGVSIFNFSSGKNLGAEVLVAAFEKEKLLNCGQIYDEAEDGEFFSITATAEKTSGADLLKTFVLKDLSSLIPLKKAKIYNIAE